LALEWFSVPIIETRDPMGVRVSEEIKSELLPLKVVGTRFERTVVIEWMLKGKHGLPKEKIKDWIKEINRRAIRRGLASYQSGKLSDLYRELVGLDQTYSKRLS